MNHPLQNYLHLIQFDFLTAAFSKPVLTHRAHLGLLEVPEPVLRRLEVDFI